MTHHDRCSIQSTAPQATRSLCLASRLPWTALVTQPAAQQQWRTTDSRSSRFITGQNLDYVYQACYRPGHRTTESNRPAMLLGWISEGVSR